MNVEAIMRRILDSKSATPVAQAMQAAVAAQVKP